MPTLEELEKVMTKPKLEPKPYIKPTPPRISRQCRPPLKRWSYEEMKNIPFDATTFVNVLKAHSYASKSPTPDTIVLTKTLPLEHLPQPSYVKSSITLDTIGSFVKVKSRQLELHAPHSTKVPASYLTSQAQRAQLDELNAATCISTNGKWLVSSKCCYPKPKPQP